MHEGQHFVIPRKSMDTVTENVNLTAVHARKLELLLPHPHLHGALLVTMCAFYCKGL